MIGTWRDTLSNIIIFAYLAWLIWLWIKPASGPLMPDRQEREED